MTERSAPVGRGVNRPVMEDLVMRVDYRKVFPAGVRAMAELERAVHSATLEPELLELVRIRASQLNGCAYCLAMHNRDARSRGSIRPGWTPSRPGGRRHITPGGSGPRWPGARR